MIAISFQLKAEIEVLKAGFEALSPEEKRKAILDLLEESGENGISMIEFESLGFTGIHQIVCDLNRSGEEIKVVEVSEGVFFYSIEEEDPSPERYWEFKKQRDETGVSELQA